MSLRKNIFPKCYMEQKQKPKMFCNTERYQKKKEEMLKFRRETYRTQHNMDLENIEVCKGAFTLYFD